jgi:hypothetical protein
MDILIGLGIGLVILVVVVIAIFAMFGKMAGKR